MTEIELKRLNKTQLYELLHKQELEIEKLTAEKKELEQRCLRHEKTGSLAEAAVEVIGIIKAAQKAANVYLTHIKAMEDSTLAAAGKLEGDAKIRALRIVEYKNAQLKGDLERIVKGLIETFNNQLSSYSDMKTTLSELIDSNDLHYLLPTGERNS